MKYERVTLEYQFDCSRCEDRQCTKDGFCYDETFCKTYNRLAELEDKIENGTLVELPCKVGDTVYVLDEDKISGEPKQGSTTEVSIKCTEFVAQSQIRGIEE